MATPLQNLTLSSLSPSTSSDNLRNQISSSPPGSPSDYASMLSEDLLGLVFGMLTARPEYLASAAGVCRRWRQRIHTDSNLLSTWSFDDDEAPREGIRDKRQQQQQQQATAQHQQQTPSTPLGGGNTLVHQQQPHTPASDVMSPVHTGRWTMGTTTPDERGMRLDGDDDDEGDTPPVHALAQLTTPQPAGSVSRFPLGQEMSTPVLDRQRGDGASTSGVAVTPLAATPLAATPLAATPLNQVVDAIGNSRGASASPHTPSPQQWTQPRQTPAEAVKRLESLGNYVGVVDVRSAFIDADTVDRLLKACPRLKVLRVSHVCRAENRGQSGIQQARAVPPPAVAAAARAAAALRGGNAKAYQPRCGCAACPPMAFRNISTWCPDLEVAEFVLQHVAFGKELRPLMTSIAQLSKLSTVAIELRRPAFGASVRSACLWAEHARVGSAELHALLDGTPASRTLTSLSVNRCDPGAAGAQLLRRRTPRLRCLALHSDVAGALGPRATVGGLAADSLNVLSGLAAPQGGTPPPTDTAAAAAAAAATAAMPPPPPRAPTASVSASVEQRQVNEVNVDSMIGIERLALGQVHTEGTAGRGAYEALAALSAPSLKSLSVECVGAPPPAAALASLRDKCPRLRRIRVSWTAAGMGDREDTISLPANERDVPDVLAKWEESAQHAVTMAVPVN